MNDITPKEAIANLNHIYGIVSPDIQRSLDVAIKVLENQTTEGDLISREALKEAISKVVAEERKEDERWAAGLRYALTLIDNAPPVDLWQMRQEATENALKKAEVLYGRPKGKWINEHYDGGFWYHTCNKCNSELEVTSTENFCRNCGADMRTKENESV